MSVEPVAETNQPTFVARHRSAPAMPAHGRALPFDLLHGGMDIRQFTAMHLMAATFPVTAGLLLFGWRAVGAIVLLIAGAVIATMIWRRVGLRGERVRLTRVVWYALLLALMLPAHLCSTFDPVTGTQWAPWPMLPAAGAALVILIWVLGGSGAGRIHPVLIAHLMLFVLFQDVLTPQYTLKRDRAFVGDLLKAPGLSREERSRTTQPIAAPSRSLSTPIEPGRAPWIAAERDANLLDAHRSTPAAQRLESFTSGHETPERAWISLESLVRDRLPPLEDLIVGGQPAPIGQGSAIALIIGGLFLLYRGLIDYRVPLLICVGALVALLVLPVPVVITETGRVARWFALRDSSVGIALGVTFANYELMASPLLFTAFYLATAPAVRPLTRRARTIYAVLIGFASAAFQLYVSVSIGPYLALLAISLLSPTLDRFFKSRPIV